MEKIYSTKTKNQNNNNKTNNHVHVTIFTLWNWWKNSIKHKLIRDEFLEDDRYIDFFVLIPAKFYIFIHPYFLSWTEGMVTIFSLYSPHNMHMKLEAYRNYSNYPYNWMGTSVYYVDM